VDRNDAIDIIRASPLSKYSDRLIAGLQECICIRTQRSAGAIDTSSFPLGTSRIGGVPDLPPGFEWPTWIASKMEFDANLNVIEPRKREKTWLDLIAQIRLEDLPAFEQRSLLPPRGTLYFFYDVANQPWSVENGHRKGWRVVFSEVDPTHLLRTAHPSGDPEKDSPLCRLTFSREWSLPEWQGPQDNAAEISSDLTLERDELLAELNPHLQHPDEPASYFDPVHRLFGYPDTVQNDMRLECQLASAGLAYNDPRADQLRPGAKEWRLLLQIDTDEDGPGWMWGDCGRIYYWIKESDLRQRRFDDTWLILQCS
jgi:uncharacterized protein YwqG